MKTICKIAKRELQRLFYSPISWVIILVLVWQASAVFGGLCGRFAALNAAGKGTGGASFIFIMNMWMSTCGALYFYIPLLTMGLLSRDLSTGTIKLLYSSPITNRQIVLGKFFAAVDFMLI